MAFFAVVTVILVAVNDFAAIIVVVATDAVVVVVVDVGYVFLQTENGKVMILFRLAANRDKTVFGWFFQMLENRT